jgi:hypothetical protein
MIYIHVPSIETVMGKKSNKEYTTIQIRKEINEHIKRFCRERNLVSSNMTETFWLQLISSSMSGSLLVGEL